MLDPIPAAALGTLCVLWFWVRRWGARDHRLRQARAMLERLHRRTRGKGAAWSRAIAFMLGITDQSR